MVHRSSRNTSTCGTQAAFQTPGFMASSSEYCSLRVVWGLAWGRVQWIPWGLDFRDENHPGGEGRAVQVRTDPSGLLGSVRRGERAFCAGGRGRSALYGGPGALPVEKARWWPDRPRTTPVCGPGAGPAGFPSTLALRFASPRCASPLPATEPRGTPRGAGAPARRLTRARKLTPGVGGVVGGGGSDHLRPQPCGATPP